MRQDWGSIEVEWAVPAVMSDNTALSLNSINPGFNMTTMDRITQNKLQGSTNKLQVTRQYQQVTRQYQQVTRQYQQVTRQYQQVTRQYQQVTR